MRLTCLIVATIGLATRSNAEFVMVSPPAPDAAAPSTVPMRPKPHPKIRPAAPDPALVGFGNRVPLRFAVRQIVPARFLVAFGETVDRDASVDWKGGKAWRPTLSDALRPLGLTASVVGAAVTIEPVPTPRRGSPNFLPTF